MPGWDLLPLQYLFAQVTSRQLGQFDADQSRKFISSVFENFFDISSLTYLICGTKISCRVHFFFLGETLILSWLDHKPFYRGTFWRLNQLQYREKNSKTPLRTVPTEKYRSLFMVTILLPLSTYCFKYV